MWNLEIYIQSIYFFKEEEEEEDGIKTSNSLTTNDRARALDVGGINSIPINT